MSWFQQGLCYTFICALLDEAVAAMLASVPLDCSQYVPDILKNITGQTTMLTSWEAKIPSSYTLVQFSLLQLILGRAEKPLDSLRLSL